MTNVPDFMPILSSGAHSSPDKGACIMEYASFLNGEQWTDQPSCTNSMLIEAAQMVNDNLDDTERQKLLPLLPRLMGTSFINETIEEGLATWLLSKSKSNIDPIKWHPGVEGYYEMLTFHTISNLSTKPDVDSVQLLSDFIDEYDRLSGRSQTPSISTEDLQRMAELTKESVTTT